MGQQWVCRPRGERFTFMRASANGETRLSMLEKLPNWLITLIGAGTVECGCGQVERWISRVLTTCFFRSDERNFLGAENSIMINAGFLAYSIRSGARHSARLIIWLAPRHCSTAEVERDNKQLEHKAAELGGGRNMPSPFSPLRT